MKNKKCYFFFKRLFDIIFSFLALIILSPLFLIISIVQVFTSGLPIFYRHLRVGKDQKIFSMVKFRSMKNDSRPISEQLSAEQYQEYLETYKVINDPRLTKFGNILRKSSLDELPQLFNIFIGQMSFIGPRPVIKEELEKFQDKKDIVTSVKPGLTGYWAVNGRSDITDYNERVKLEVYYVEHCSLVLDIKIFFKTIIVVFTRKGAQ